MKPITYSAETWAEIRQRYEAGETAGMISRSLGGSPSKVAITKRAKKERWSVVSERLTEWLPAVAGGNRGAVNNRTLCKPEHFGKNTPETKAIVVYVRSIGGTYKMAAQATGVAERTLRHWRENDATFAAECEAARVAPIAEVLETVGHMAKTDFHAAKFLLERDPLTRDEFAPPGIAAKGFGPTTFNVLGHVSVGIDRDEGRIIEAEVEA